MTRSFTCITSKSAQIALYKYVVYGIEMVFMELQSIDLVMVYIRCNPRLIVVDAQPKRSDTFWQTGLVMSRALKD